MHTSSPRRSLYTALFCSIALLALLLRGTPVHAQAVTLDVDAASGTVAPGDVCPAPRDSATYTTIQKAVDCAQAGDTIAVAAGTYAEVIDIDKSLTLQGNGREDDANATRIDTTVVHGISGRSSCLVIANGTSDVTISGFRFEGDGQQPPSPPTYSDGENAIYFTSHDTDNRLAGITINGNTIVDTDRAIVAGGFLTASEISDNLFEGITDWWVILIQNFDSAAVLDDLTISGNEIRNSTSVPIALMNYSPSPNMSNVLLENNYIHDNDASNPRTAGHIWNREGQSGGIVARYGWQNMTIRNNVIANNLDMSGVGIWGTSQGYANLTIEGNVLHNNTGSDRFSSGVVDPSYPASGIKVQWGSSSYDTSTWSVTGNSISGNSFGLWYDGSYGTLTAENNWWGSADGPLDSTGSTELPTTPEPAVADMLNAAPAGTLGDEVSEDIDYHPWLSSSLAGDVWVDDGWTGQADVDVYDPSLVWQYDAFAVIQDGVDAVAAGGTVHVLAGTYSEEVTIDQALTLQGESGAVIDGGGSLSTGIRVHSSDVTVDGFEIANFGSSGIVVGYESDPPGDLQNVRLTNNTVHDISDAVGHGFGIYVGYQSEAFDPHNTGLYEGLTELLDYAGLEISASEIYSTAQAALVLQSIQSSGSPLLIQNNHIYDTSNSSIWIDAARDLTITGNDLYNASTGIYFSSYADSQNYTVWGAPDLTYSPRDVSVTENNIYDNSNGIVLWHGWPGHIWINENSITGNTTSGIQNHLSGGSSIDSRFNWWGAADGPGGTGPGSGDEISANVAYCPWLDAAYPGGSPASANGNLVTNLDTGEMFCAIQAAIDDPDTVDGHTISATAGIYTETVVISKSLTVRGATYDVNKNGYTVPANYAWDPAVESIISAPNPFLDGIVVDIANTSNVTFEGFVVQSLYSTGGGGSGSDPHLVRVSARTQTVDNVTIRNNVIGPNTHPSQDGTMGRMGLYLATPGYNGYGLTNSLIRGNLIMDAKGNGNNVFIWGAADSYHDLGNTDYGGTVIEDNEISGSHRSGIEIAGGVDHLTIRDNAIHSNSGLPADDPANLKYGNGILIVRMGSDKDNPDGYGPDNLTLSGNVIYDNEKNGIYLGPVNASHEIASNVLRNNGWDGLRIDLTESYYGGTGAVYSRTQNIVMAYNRILNNAGYGSQGIGTRTNGFVLDAEDNWWGCNYGPGAGGVGCDGTPNGIAGIIDADPWLTLDLEITPSTLPAGAPATLAADLTWNSVPADTSAGGHLPDGTPAAFGATAGLIAATPVTTTSGVATTIWTSGPAGTAVLSTTVDGQTITRTAVISAHGAAASVTLSPDPYTVAAGASVSYTVTASDAYGNQWDATGETGWAIDPAAGGAWDGSTYTSEVAGTWTVTGTVGGAPGTATLTVLAPGGSTIYLPLVMRGYSAAPDLVVERITATADQIEVVIANRGTETIASLPENTFWVDVYLDPAPAPAAVNETWPFLGVQGAAWGVTSDALPLAPGDTMTLTTGGAYYWAELSTIAWPLDVGTAVYAQVDSAHTDSTYGAIREGHEIAGTGYNNILGPQLSTAAVMPDAHAGRETPPARAPMPPRP